MYRLEELEKRQIGLRIPQYLIDEIDAFTTQFSLSRTEIIIEALRSYIAEQKEYLLDEKELLNRVTDIKNKRVEPLSRNDVFDEL